MYESIDFQIQGLAPTIMHNGQTADPLNEFSKALKVISSKRKKTDEDHLEMSRIEFMASFYLDAERRPAWPGENIETGMKNAAKSLKLGTTVLKAVFCPGIWTLDYKGPATPEALWEDKRFVDRRRVCVNNSSVMRTRVRFDEWKLKFTLNYMPDLLNREQVIQIATIFGRDIGLSDYRPRFGRFEILKPSAVRAAA